MIRYLAALAAIAALGMAVLLPYRSLDLEDMKELKQLAVRRPAATILLGNSVSRTFSRCDADTASIGDMMAAAGAPVVELARGGLKLDKMMKYGRLATRVRDVDTVVLPIQVYDGFLQLAEADSPPSIMRLMSAERSHFEAATPSGDETYRGVRYGNLGEISATYFPVEAAAMTCPENEGRNRDFVAYMYWRNYLRTEHPVGGLAELAAYRGELEARSVNLLAVFMPQNLALMKKLHGETAVAQLREQVALAMQALRSDGARVLDLTDAVGQEHFIDQWCACGHLGEHGRRKVAQTVARLLRDPLPLSTAAKAP